MVCQKPLLERKLSTKCGRTLEDHKSFWSTISRKQSLIDPSEFGSKICSWISPLKGKYKLNFDVAFVIGCTFTGVILRNDMGVVLNA